MPPTPKYSNQSAKAKENLEKRVERTTFRKTRHHLEGKAIGEKGRFPGSPDVASAVLVTNVSSSRSHFVVYSVLHQAKELVRGCWEIETLQGSIPSEKR